ncbi:hypothetical protein GQ473_00295 [archaeon]|nr:hypothetical protein [archaeon]
MAVFLLIGVASAAILTEYFRDERTVEVTPWMSFDVNNDPRDTTYGLTQLYDYINITSHKKYSTTCEIDTEIWFNGEELIDTEGIKVDYSVESGSGALITPSDNNNNGLPEAAVFGTQDADGIYTIRRNININEDLIPGTYRIVTILVPYQGNS